jgi:hypothetical protein
LSVDGYFSLKTTWVNGKPTSGGPLHKPNLWKSLALARA